MDAEASLPRLMNLTDGTVVAVTEYGDPAGAPVLALHGAPDSRLIFSVADAPARSLGLRLICPDRPGYGRSTPDRTPTLASRAASLHEVADKMGLEAFGLLGVSGGSPSAVALAARLGRRCTALAIVSPIGPVAEVMTSGGEIAPGFRRFFIEFQRWPRLLRLLSHLAVAVFRLAPELWMRFAAVPLPKADRAIVARPEIGRLLMASMSEALRQGVQGGLDDLAIYARPWNVDYAAITARTLLWQGSDDRIVPPVATAYLAARIPGAQLQTIAGAGHFWVFDHVHEVLAALAGAITRSRG